MDDEQILFSFAVFAREVVRIDHRLKSLFRKWLYEDSTAKGFLDIRETIKIPIPQEMVWQYADSPEDTINEKSIIVRPVMWRDASGKKTMRAVIEMPQMDFIL